MKRFIVLLGLALVAFAGSAYADEAQQCLWHGTLTTTRTWSNCPQAPAPTPKRRVVHHYRHNPADDAYVPPEPAYNPPAPYYPAPAYAPSPSAQPVAGCPNGYTLTVYGWYMDTLRPDLRAQAEALIAAAESRFTVHASMLDPYKPDDVSRRLGGDIRRSTAVVPISFNVLINYLDPNQPTRVIQPQVGRVIGRGPNFVKLALPGIPPQYAVETIFPQNFVSPTATDGTGPRRLRLFGYEWKGRFQCDMIETGLVPGGPQGYGRPTM